MEESGSSRKPRRRFSEEFKREAIRLVVDEPYAIQAAADSLRIGVQTLRQKRGAVTHCRDAEELAAAWFDGLLPRFSASPLQ